MDKNIVEKGTILNATKWSSITEIMAKLVTPISNIILARLLLPEIFGVVASINMIVSFADVFADAGFQKYLIQHDFKSDQEYDEYICVAFWTNMVISFFAWIIIVIFSKNLAFLVGSQGKEKAIIISAVNLIFTSFSSIQMAIYKRNFEYKTLFIVKIFSIIVPFIVTIPLAIITRSYWALILGTLASNLINAIIMTIKSRWKPKLYYSIVHLKNMFSFSFWSLCESILVWCIAWGDTFIVSFVLSDYYLGLYKTSMSTVNSIINLVVVSTSSVLLSTLSRVKNNDVEYKKIYYKFQRYVSIVLIPMGVGIFIYRDFICKILLGAEWMEAASFIGIWGLISSISIFFNSYSGIVCTSKEKPKLSVEAQIIQLAFIFPVVYFSSRYSYSLLTYSRAYVRVVGFLVFMFILKRNFGISVFKVIQNLMPATICSLLMAISSVFMKGIFSNSFGNIISITLSALIYFILLFILFPNIRREIFDFAINNLVKKKRSFE